MPEPDSPPRPPEDRPRPPESSGRGRIAWRDPAIAAAIITVIGGVAVALVGIAFGDKASNSPTSTAAPAVATTTPDAGPITNQAPIANSSTSSPPPAQKWDALYRDKEILLKSSDDFVCGGGWSVDFDTGEAYSAPIWDTDLTTSCTNGDVVPGYSVVWARSVAALPTPQECSDSAKTNPIPTEPVELLVIDSAYCLVTSDRNLVWFKIIRTHGKLGLSLTATLWKSRN